MTEPEKFGFVDAKWSFFEAGHGKGIPDAIGGSLKREADRRVKYGRDVACAKDFIECLKDSKTKVWLVEDHTIDQKKDILQNLTIKPIPGTFKLHQIGVRDQSLVCKQLSCECYYVCENCEVSLKPSKQNKTCSNTKTKPNLCRSKKRKQIEDMNSKDADSQKVKKALKNKSIHIKI